MAGVILYPKRAGVSSHDVVASVRRRLSEEYARRLKVGHAGTLDPFATGLLLVLVGRATRAQRFLMALPKTYRAVVRLGWTSTTGDPEGELACTGREPESPLPATGEQLQRPPAFSAVKVAGERLYRRARRGDAIEGPVRRVQVYRAELLWRDGERAGIEIECSAGTYVRQLVADLGDAYCEELERTAIGPFRLADAHPERLVPLAQALGFLPERPLGVGEADRVSHGGAIADGVVQDLEGQDVVHGYAAVPRAVRLTHAGELVALAEQRGDRLKPVVVFAG
jgi:tRNA pseudouridine55 synthase